MSEDFIDCGKEDKDAQEVVDILNRFYREDKKHKVGVNGWTVENPPYRQSYAPDILQDLLEKLEEFPGKICCPSLPWRRRSAMPLMNIMPFVTSSKEVRRLSITTILRESRGTYHYQEETQCSLARTKEQDVRLSYIPSPSHARLNGINLFEYRCDVIEKTASNGNQILHGKNIETYFLTDGKSSNSISLISCYCFFLNYARYKRGDVTVEV